MLIKDVKNRIYKTGLKLDYSPKLLNFDDDFSTENITAMGCGRKHYVLLNKDNKLLVWGNVFKEKPIKESEGFGLYFGDNIFNGGKVVDLSLKYSIYGAIVEHN